MQRDARRWAWSFGWGSSLPPFSDQKRPDLPGSWGTLLCLCPALRPRQDRCPQAPTGQRHGPR